ncbi:hypothetical protein [Streptomyces sp. V4I2]|nr:hypothetical protein [Streptomyces sp. V4I2]MDQ1051109.1 hypothetical protein [Streptomyces sp. V4I2]
MAASVLHVGQAGFADHLAQLADENSSGSSGIELDIEMPLPHA